MTKPFVLFTSNLGDVSASQVMSNTPFTAATGITAGVGGTQANAVPLTNVFNKVATVTSANDSVLLPPAVAGIFVIVVNDAATNAMQVFGAGTDTIDDVAYATGISQPAGESLIFFCPVNGAWYTIGGSEAGEFINLLVTGASTFQGSVAMQGALTQKPVVVAAAGATQGTATAIAATALLVNVTVTASSEGVKLPTAATGRTLTLLPPTTKGVKVYGGAAGQLINTTTTATTAYAMVSGQPVIFYAVDATHWRAQTASDLIGATLAVSGKSTLSGGLSTSGAQIEGITIVAAAGATQGTATAISAAAATVNVTTTTSSEGVKLPTAATGRVVTVLPPNNLGVKVYGGAAGQLINAATTATTAYAVGSGQQTLFWAVDTTHWRAKVAGSIVGTTGLFSGLLTASAGLTVSQTLKGGTITIAAAGATQGTATAITATAVVVNVTTTTSAEGVKLPTATTGRMILVNGGTGKLFKVYGGAAGQSINAATTATTAYVMASLKPVLFIGISATKWTAIKSG